MTDPKPLHDDEPRGGTEATPPWRPHQLLAALPGLTMLAGIPLANRIEPYVLGLPFLLFWILAWVVLTAVVMGVVYALDEAGLARSRDAGTARTGEEER